jgi:hypothetical protein
MTQNMPRQGSKTPKSTFSPPIPPQTGILIPASRAGTGRGQNIGGIRGRPQ